MADDRLMLRSLQDALTETRLEIMRVQREINEVSARLQEYQHLQARRMNLLGHLERLNTEYRGLEVAVARRGGMEAATEEGDDWTTLSRPEAVVRALMESPVPLGPNEIAHVLAGHGREGDRPKGVSVALMRLRKRGEVRQVERGSWMAGAEGRDLFSDEDESGEVIPEE
jgi:hypothetical protein